MLKLAPWDRILFWDTRETHFNSVEGATERSSESHSSATLNVKLFMVAQSSFTFLTFYLPETQNDVPITTSHTPNKQLLYKRYSRAFEI